MGAGQSLSVPQQEEERGSEVVSPFKTPQGTEFAWSVSPITGEAGRGWIFTKMTPYRRFEESQ